MDITKLRPILNKESILITANARELGQAPQDVLERYRHYALTHVPLGDTTKQLKNLERVETDLDEYGQFNLTTGIGSVAAAHGSPRPRIGRLA